MGKTEPTITLIQTVDNQHLALFAQRLRDWLMAASAHEAEETSPSTQPGASVFTESRAKALLKATNATDDATLNDFARLIEQETAVRLALHDIIKHSGLKDNDEVTALAAVANQSAIQHPPSAIDWLSLSMAAFAWKSGYPLNQLDPATPPEPYSPAGQAVKRTAHFLRQQIQRSATERDKLARKLAFSETVTADTTPNLDSLPTSTVQPPLPPYYRPPIPVNYPEIARDTVSIHEDEPTPEPAPTPSRSASITITEDDLNPAPLPGNVTRMPSIRITHGSSVSAASTTFRLNSGGDASQRRTDYHELHRIGAPNIWPQRADGYDETARFGAGISRWSWFIRLAGTCFLQRY
ncbi:MAG: hypothetical protein M5U34_29670 [Chloroflexi bacterium]|nr:hypothetical protein [Chloroflexota bacterium]